MNKFFEGIGKFFVFWAALLITYAAGGIVLFVFWDWFLAGLFQVDMSFPRAIGISTLITFLANRNIPKSGGIERWETRVGIFLANAIAYPVLIVCVGWIITQFM